LYYRAFAAIVGTGENVNRRKIQICLVTERFEIIDRPSLKHLVLTR
jgi:hypothetical protein